MSLDYYNAQEKHWVSPRLVLLYYDDLLKKYGLSAIINERRFDKAIEARTVAINLLGMQKRDPKNYIMQVPKEINESPDIVTAFRKEYKDRPVQLELQDVEVVEYTTDETRDLSTFLIEEKLSPLLSRKAYDEKTTILCHIKKPGRFNPNTIHGDIKKVSPKSLVLLLGKISEGNYETTQVWPVVGNIQYNVIEEVKKYPKPDSLKLTLGTNKKIINTQTGLPLPSLEEVFEIK